MYNGSYVAGSLSSYGSYYTGRTANTLEPSDNITAKDFTDNLCFKNWTLPTNSDFALIVKSYSSSWNKIKSGYYYSSSLTLANTEGVWWSRTGRSNGSSFNHLWLNSSGLTDGSYTSALYGISVRCLAR